MMMWGPRDAARRVFASSACAENCTFPCARMCLNGLHTHTHREVHCVSVPKACRMNLCVRALFDDVMR